MADAGHGRVFVLGISRINIGRADRLASKSEDGLDLLSMIRIQSRTAATGYVPTGQCDDSETLWA